MGNLAAVAVTPTAGAGVGMLLAPLVGMFHDRALFPLGVSSGFYRTSQNEQESSVGLGCAPRPRRARGVRSNYYGTTMFAVLRKRTWALLISSVCLVAATVVLAAVVWNARGTDFLCHEVAFWGREDAPAITLNGEQITCTEVKQLVLSYVYLRLSHTASQAVGLLISDALVRQELNPLGLAVSGQEVEMYVQQQKARCLDGSGSECRAAIVELGLDPRDETYWKLAGPIFRRDLERVRLNALLVQDMGLEQVGADEAGAALDLFYRRLEEDAKIVWHDVSLKRDYEEQ